MSAGCGRTDVVRFTAYATFDVCPLIAVPGISPLQARRRVARRKGSRGLVPVNMTLCGGGGGCGSEGRPVYDFLLVDRSRLGLQKELQELHVGER